MKKTFTCKYCQRTLPKWMDTGGKRCTDCSDSADTQHKIEDIRESRSISSKKSRKPQSNTTKHGSQRQDTRYQGSAEPEVVDPSNYTDSSEEENHSGIPPEIESGKKERSTQSLSRHDVSKNHDMQLYHQPDKPNEHQDLPDCDVFSLGWYHREDFQKDPYSSRLIRLCKENVLSELSFFKSRLLTFFDQRLDDRLNPDMITIYPGHTGNISEGLATLAESVSKVREFQYSQVLSRSQTRPPQHVQSHDNRWDNQRGSISAENSVQNSTIFVLDDICTSGASMTVAKQALVNRGANIVIGVCLGLSTNQPGQYVKRIQDDKHSIEGIINE